MSQPYVIPGATRIGHAHLKVADLDRALGFYCGLLGIAWVGRPRRPTRPVCTI